MTIYSPPELSETDFAVIDMIDKQKQELKYFLQNVPLRWGGIIRRNAMARAIQGSNTIEGYNATMDDVIAAVVDEEPMDAKEEVWREIVGYRNAMTYVLQLAEDEHFEFHSQLIRSLHFMMLQHSLQKMPGRWRAGEIFVFNNETEERVYTGPDAGMVQNLVDELMSDLNSQTNCPLIVKAAMAHLNLAMIHPFKDGNGRMARALQTLVLSREGMVSPVFSSIEEWLGRNTPAYYDILARTGGGKWSPENDAHAWIKFNLRAHYQQAQTIVKRNNWYSKIYENVKKIQERYKLPERSYSALMDGSIGARVRAGPYREEHGISDVVASRDLKKLTDLDLLIPHGERRGRYYTGSPLIQDFAKQHKISGRSDDPYILVEQNLSGPSKPQIQF